MSTSEVPATIGQAASAEIEGAAAYDAVMVPAVMDAWTVRTAEAARIGPGDRVLDVACGTGALTRELASRVGAGGTVTGLDRNRGMLTVAWRRAPHITWREGTAEQLPFAAGNFDAVLCQFGLMFVADRRQAIAEMARVLAPGGRVAITVWDALENIPAYAAETALVERLAGAAAGAPLRAPFALGDPDAVAALLRDSGFDRVEVRTERAEARFPSLQVMLEADLRGWLPVMGVHLDDELITRIITESERELAPIVDRRDGAAFGVTAHITSAIRP